MTYKTEQENFWAGEFGSGYIGRNTLKQLLPARLALFAKIVARAPGISDVLEFGPNIGANLLAIHNLLPAAQIKAVEINPEAVSVLKSYPWIGNVVQGSLLDPIHDQADLTFTSGVLIHINPEFLPLAYENLFRTSRKFILVCEYYNPIPVSVPYRGHADRLFKRDFAGDLMDTHRGHLELIDYGFCYRRDQVHPMDDLSWFLMKKT